jgi:glycosyltransferase involved in cell wall biosynthesis
MKKIKIGIMHQSVCVGDAIGNDIMGSYLSLEKLGFEPEIVCQYPDKKIPLRFRQNINCTPSRIKEDYILLIYHHSGAWSICEDVIKAFQGKVVIKYHNITPHSFFAAYSQRYEDVCRQGREQTQRLVKGGKVALWQSDSSFNAAELSSAGVELAINKVVPPFNRLHELSSTPHYAKYEPGQQVDLLFVGRRAPNKGQRHLLHIMSSYIRLYSGNIKLKIVGAVDDQLIQYSDELMALSEQLGVTKHIEWLTHISNQELDGLFRSSHLYVNMSEHEGFCVPIIEAQAIGLPVITFNSTALGETTGINQLVCPPPNSEEDYDVMAGLVHEVATNKALRESLIRHGYKNAYERFTQEHIENRFIGSLEPIFRNLS